MICAPNSEKNARSSTLLSLLYTTPFPYSLYLFASTYREGNINSVIFTLRSEGDTLDKNTPDGAALIDKKQKTHKKIDS